MVTKVTPIRSEDEDMTINKMFMAHSGRKAEKVDINRENETKEATRTAIPMPSEPLSWGKVGAGVVGALAVVGGVFLAFKQFSKAE
jgi:hypothetical protein